MQETINLLSNRSNFPSPNHDSPSVYRRRPRTRLHFPHSISSKTITAVSVPSKPPPARISEISVQSLLRSPAPPFASSPDFQEKIYYLDSIGLDAFSLVTNHRSILLSATLPDIKSSIDYLASLDFNAHDFRRIVTLCPGFLAAASGSTVISIVTFLLREGGVEGHNLRRVILRRPKLLICSVDQQLRPALEFLKTIGISTAFRHAYLLSCSVEGMLVPRIRYLQGLGLSYWEAAAMVKRFPQLFNYSLEGNMEPKVKYLLVEMGREVKELKEFPQYFSFSLEKRIMPRHQLCVEKGVCLPLAVLLRTKEGHFRRGLMNGSLASFYSSLPLTSSPLFRVDFDTMNVPE